MYIWLGIRTFFASFECTGCDGLFERVASHCNFTHISCTTMYVTANGLENTAARKSSKPVLGCSSILVPRGDACFLPCFFRRFFAPYCSPPRRSSHRTLLALWHNLSARLSIGRESHSQIAPGCQRLCAGNKYSCGISCRSYGLYRAYTLIDPVHMELRQPLGLSVLTEACSEETNGTYAYSHTFGYATRRRCSPHSDRDARPRKRPDPRGTLCRLSAVCTLLNTAGLGSPWSWAAGHVFCYRPGMRTRPVQQKQCESSRSQDYRRCVIGFPARGGKTGTEHVKICN